MNEDRPGQTVKIISSDCYGFFVSLSLSHSLFSYFERICHNWCFPIVDHLLKWFRFGLISGIVGVAFFPLDSADSINKNSPNLSSYFDCFSFIFFYFFAWIIISSMIRLMWKTNRFERTIWTTVIMTWNEQIWLMLFSVILRRRIDSDLDSICSVLRLSLWY